MVGISVPPAGITPKGKPSAVPRIQGPKLRFHSSRVIHRLPETGSTSALSRVQ